MVKFEFYVLNYNMNQRKIKNFNVFDNILVNEHTEKAIRKYLRAPSKYKYEYSSIFQKEPLYGFEALCEEIRTIIRWQEWSRCEYEILVTDLFEDDLSKAEKWDCYKQCEPNIKMITHECIRQYKEQIKNGKTNEQ